MVSDLQKERNVLQDKTCILKNNWYFMRGDVMAIDFSSMANKENSFLKCKCLSILTILNVCIILGPLNMHIAAETAQYEKDTNFLTCFKRTNCVLKKREAD